MGLVVLGGCLTLMVMPDEAPVVPATLAEEAGFDRPPTVVIDPGHGGRDEGTKWYGVNEKDMTLDLAVRVEGLLKSAGFPTLLTRRDNLYVSLEDRVNMANRLPDALFVSLHFNSDPAGSSTGIETYYAREKAPPETEWTWVGFFNHPEPQADTEGEVLAGAVHAALMNRTEARNRGIRPSNFYVVHHTRHPAVLVECGFLSNVMDLQMLRNEGYRDLLAAGIAEGVISYQKQHPKPERQPSAPRIASLRP